MEQIINTYAQRLTRSVFEPSQAKALVDRLRLSLGVYGVVNVTQHPATQDQVAAGVRDLPDGARAKVSSLLTFAEIPCAEEIRHRARLIVREVRLNVEGSPHAVMIGGAPYLMPALEEAVRQCGWIPVYAFSQRESAEVVQPDGSVRKTNVFRHGGFVVA